MVRRRSHYSTSLAIAQGIIPECVHLFEYWEEGMSVKALFELVRSQGVLGVDSDRRTRNIVMEGFGSRFLREPHDDAAIYLKAFMSKGDPKLRLEIILLYALRQHGIFFDFMVEIYWPAIRSGRQTLDTGEVQSLIDHGRIDQKLETDWTEAMRKRVSSYVLGIAHDFELLGDSSRGSRSIQQWIPSDGIILYLAYDLHFLGLSDDEVIVADEWQALGLEREDVIAYLNRLDQRGHLTLQDSGVISRIEWKYQDRTQLNDALLRR
ncbi:DUF1819 family protein [Verrucomicrobiales bacterium]|nr:DUF1819 family protein [Verrucomicrobiales bacterium]